MITINTVPSKNILKNYVEKERNGHLQTIINQRKDKFITLTNISDKWKRDKHNINHSKVKMLQDHGTPSTINSLTNILCDELDNK